MTLQEAVELLCEKERHHAKSGDIVVKMVDPEWELFNLSTIDGCLALAKELGLDKENEDWVADRYYYSQHYRGNIFRIDVELIQAALAAGIEWRYKEKP